MIQEFIESWALFHNSYLAGTFIAICLGLVGVLSVARDQIFIGAAISEASAFGIAVGMTFCGLLHFDPATSSLISEDTFHRSMAVLFSVAASLLTVRRTSQKRESHEAVTGWIFLISSSGAVLLMANSPHGLEEIHNVLFSASLLGAKQGDVSLFALLAVVTAAVMAWFHRPILLTTLDPDTASAIGVRTTAWSFGGATVLGLLIGLSIHIAGSLFTFGCLILPALIAKNLLREVRSLLVAAPIIAGVTTMSAFVIANAWNLPPGQAAVGLLSLLVLPAWAFRLIRLRLQSS